MKKIFIILMFFSNIAYAKDIPQNFEKEALLNYEKLEKKTKKVSLRRFFAKDKQKYNFLIEKDKLYLNIEKEKKIKKRDYIVKRNTLREEKREKKIKEIKLKTLLRKKQESEYFFETADKNQSQLICPITPILKKENKNRPKDFYITNNLRRRTGTADIARGEIIYVKGRLRDINCTPIAGAIINLWHNSAEGKRAPLEHIDKNFIGSGTVITDNLGGYEFITILTKELKKKNGKKAPHLNLFVSHRSFSSFETKIYFPYHILNQKDVELSSISDYNQSLLTGSLRAVDKKHLPKGFIMAFDMTVNSIINHRKL